MVGAVLLDLASPGLRGSGRGEDGGGSSQQGSSSVGQHVVMLHNRTIWIANGSRVEDDAIDRGGGGSSAGRLIATLRMMSACDTRRSRYGGGEGFQGCVGVWEELVGAI